MLNKLPGRLILLLLCMAVLAGSVFGSRCMARNLVEEQEQQQPAKSAATGGARVMNMLAGRGSELPGQASADLSGQVAEPVVMARWLDGHILRFGLRLPGVERVTWLEYPEHSPIRYGFPNPGQITFPDGRTFSCVIDNGK